VCIFGVGRLENEIMSMQKQKIVPIQNFRYVLLLAILCSISVPASAEQQSDKESRAAQIKAELATLKQDLAALESQPAKSVQADEEEATNFFEMSIEELMNVKVETSAALTKTSRRLTPFALTTITQEDIRRSQARSLYELLEMYVPNLQMIFTSEQPKALGLRGIISHRSDKFLLLVNGRIMNERMDSGVMTEVDLPMLTDIHHIDVIRGPSAALYGPGAESMTINIVTDNANTFQGEEITVRGGVIEKYATVEYKLGKKLGEDSGIFVYAGVSQYNGADAADSPTVLGTTAPFALETSGHYPSLVWTPYQGGDKIDTWFKNLNQMPFDKPKMKMYAEYTKGEFDIWARYTQGGQWIDFTQWNSELGEGDGFWGQRESSDEGITYTQATVQASYDQEVSDDLSVKYVTSYDRITNENDIYTKAFYWKSFSEDELYGKILARWNPAENHSVAFGGEWTHNEFGKRFGDTPISNQPFAQYQDWGQWVVPRWNTDRPALLGEYQWNINDQFTLFLNSRVDWHPYTETMFSPRGVLVYTPNKKDTFKLMASRSVQTNSAAQMYIDHTWFNTKSPVEKLDALELRYERQHNDNLWFAGSVFLYNVPDALGENQDNFPRTFFPLPTDNGGTSSKTMGNVRSWGFELEAGYHKDKLKVDLSHSYTKLLNMSDASAGVTWNQYSAAPFGFGNDFAQWENHITKIRAEYGLSDKLIVNGTLCVLWGSPGGQDWAEYRHYLYAGDYESGFDKPFEPSAYLNLGAEYKWSKNTTLNVTGYNLLGLLDEDMNKRRVGFDDQLPGHYRIQPVAIGASLTHKF
jgi:iron complex outermembrane receptor protein